MPRVPIPFRIDAVQDQHRPHHLRVVMSGDLDSQEGRDALKALLERILRDAPTIVVVNAQALRVGGSEGAESWFAFANALPGTVQIIYGDSHLSIIVEYSDEYRPGHVNDVHVRLMYDP